MIQRKRLQIVGLACLLGALSLHPAMSAFAAWTKVNGIYTDSSGTAIAGVAARGIDVSHWQQSINWDAVAADDIQFVMLGTRYNNAVDPFFSPTHPRPLKQG